MSVTHKKITSLNTKTLTCGREKECICQWIVTQLIDI